MPIRPPALDDRSFDDLVEEMLARIPAHTPEWTNPRLGDPGRTLIELFAWLVDTLLYRANLIPERQRLAFLQLLGQPLKPAQPAKGLVTVTWGDESHTHAVALKTPATIQGPVPYETQTELTILPIAAEAYYKRPVTEAERHQLHEVILGLRDLYNIEGDPDPYVTTPVFAGGAPDPNGLDVVHRTVDRSLWLALLAPKKELVADVRATLGDTSSGRQQILNVGLVPTTRVPGLFESIGPRAPIPHRWEISYLNAAGELDFVTVDTLPHADSTKGLTQAGIVRLILPSAEFLQAPSNNVLENLFAGVGDAPPRLDDPDKASRLVTWLRLRAMDPSRGLPVEHLSLSWIGINAVDVIQYETITGKVLGVSNGMPHQEFSLSARSVDPRTIRIEVEEPNAGFRPWFRIDDFTTLHHNPTVAREARAYTLDSEAGLIRFGDGVRGRIPEAGQRIRAASMRAGGGRAGNVPPGTLKTMTAVSITGALVNNLKIQQPMPLRGGEDAETLEQAERRIPSLLKHRDRAVTSEDYRILANESPGIDVGRLEVLPRFKPHQRRFNVPGVVSVMVWPDRPMGPAPNPRPDRPFLETVHRHLDVRRPLGTELYVIGCEYIGLGISLSVSIREGFGDATVLQHVREALRRLFWPLPPGGLQGEGWPLGRAVRDQEVEVEVSRVAGINSVVAISLFEKDRTGWRNASHALELREWQLPELLQVVIEVVPPETLTAEAPDLEAGPKPSDAAFVAIPVVPDTC
ncbi:MAG: putative baseplate assembly protein [Nitrospirae bacterium]|nr:MAG: putative baseplate assembly protein [Nitrospirota bacterium]